MNKTQFHNVIFRLFTLTRKYEQMTTLALALKVSEEVGELAEVILKDNGYLKHKQPSKEDAWHEVADIINVLIGMLAKHYPNLSATELTENLYNAIEKKGKKYEKILTGQPIM